MEVEALYDYAAEQDDELTIKKGDIITSVVQADSGWFEGELNGRKGVFPDNFVKIILAADLKSPTKIAGNMSASDSSVNFRKEKKRKCKVLFSYQPVNDDELPLEVDTIIDVVEEVEEGWWKGVVNGKSGVFPSNFVEEMEASEAEPEQTVPPKSEKTLNQEAIAEIKPRPIKGVGYGNIFQDGKIKLRATSSVYDQKPPASPVNKKSPFSNTNVTAVADAPQLPPKRAKELAVVLFSYEAQNDDELSLKEGDTIKIISKDAEDVGWWKGKLNGSVGVFPDNFVQLITAEEPKPKKPERPEKLPNVLKGPPKPDRDTTDSVSWRDKSESVSSPARKEKVTSLPRGLSSKRLPPDIPKKEEKIDRSVPPLPSKKPQLPPPMKKIGRLSASLTGAVTAPVITPAQPSSQFSNANADAGFGDTAPKAELPKPDNLSNNSDLDVVETSSEKLVHLTAQRAKNPNRRPPSHVFLKGDNNNGLHEKENGEAVEAETPWMRELRKNQAVKRNSHAYHEIMNMKDSIAEVDEKTQPRISALKSIEVDEKLSNRVSSNCFRKPTPPLTSPIKPKQLTVEVDGKDMFKNDKSFTASTTSADATSLPPLTSEPTLAELAKLCSFFRDNCITKSEHLELKRECTDLRNSLETFKALTSRRITELIREVEDEKSQRLTLQAELDRLKAAKK